MADTSSTTTFRADISSLRAEMQAASRAVKVANSEFRAATAGMDDWSSSADGLEAKIKQLNTVLEAQNKQVELAEKELRAVEEEYGENSAEADRARIKYNNFKAAAAQTQRELDNYEDQLESVEDTTEDVEEATESAGDGFTVFKGAIADLAADVIKSAVSGLKDLAKETLKVGMDFESAMSQVEATSGASAEEIERLSDKAKEMGAKTKFSATESAEAFNYMAMAGWKTEDMIDGIEGIMNLAAASGADLATTSDIVTDALTAMGYEAKDAGHLADVMAAASSNANTNVELMGATFQYAAPIVGALGYNMEDTAVAIGMMANAGIKGEKAGTALRSILTRLSAPPKECAEAMSELGISLTKVNDDGTETMKDMDEVMQDLRDAFDGLSETQQTQMAKALAGQQAMSGLLAIVNGSQDDFDKLTAAVAGSDGAAQSMADTMNDNVAGALTLLQSNVESKMIQVFEAASPSIQAAIEAISEALDQIDWDAVGEATGKIAEKFGEFVTWCLNNGDTVKGILEGIGAAIGTVFVVNKVSNFISSVSRLKGAFLGLKNRIAGSSGAEGAVGLLSTALANLPVLAVTGGLLAIGGAAMWSASQYEKQIQKEWGLSEAQQGTIDKIHELSGSYDRMKEDREKSYKDIDSEYGYLEGLIGEYNGLIDENGHVIEGYEDRAEFIKTTLAEALGIEREDLDKNIGKNGELGDSIRELIELKRAEAMVSATQDSYTDAIHNRQDALDLYTQALSDAAEQEETYSRSQKELSQAQENLDKAIEEKGERGSMAEAQALENARHANDVAKKAYEEEMAAVKEAEKTYIGYNSTIENYEGLSAAVISGDNKKISDALIKLENDFQSANTGTRESLQEQYDTYKQQYRNMKKAVKEGTANISDEQLSEMKKLVRWSRQELEKMPEETAEVLDDVVVGIKNTDKVVEKAATDVGESATDGLEKGAEGAVSAALDPFDEVLVGIANVEDETEKASEKVGEAATEGLENAAEEVESAALDPYDEVLVGIENKQDDIQNASEETGEAATEGLEEGSKGMATVGGDTMEDWLYFIGSFGDDAESTGEGVADSAEAGLNTVDTTQSGEYFGQGYVNGISNKNDAAYNAGKTLGQKATSGLKEGQKEGSPSKITYQSGRFFTQGYINGIVSEQRTLGKVVQGLVKTAITELGKLSAYNFSEVAENATSAVSDAVDRQTNYMIAKIQYQNEDKLDDLDAEIKKLEKQKQAATEKLEKASNKKVAALEKKKDKAKSKSAKKRIEKQIEAEKNASKKRIAASEKEYDKLISLQEKYQTAYGKASAEMIAQLQDALSDYQIQAQELIDNTINGITSKYESDYNTLIQKQDNLISKLRDAADLFTVSNAGVLLIGDIEDQTRQIREYTERLRQIKNRVSSELFDKIAEYDMKEGNAYMDYLLRMSETELEAYNQAYTDKLKAAAESADIIYGEDIKNVAKQYQSEIEKAFSGLPEQLEKLGEQAMQGFIDGLAFNTDFMHSEIRTFILAMIDEFKDQLQINSPSKVTFGIGEYAGEGFVDGILSLIRKAKSAASELAGIVSSPLSTVTGNVGSLRGIAPASSIGSGGNGGVVNNYNLVQNNNSPKALTALETYQARRRQIALVKAFG